MCAHICNKNNEKNDIKKIEFRVQNHLKRNMQYMTKYNLGKIGSSY